MVATVLLTVATILSSWLDCFREARSTQKKLLNVLRVCVVILVLLTISGLSMWLSWIASGRAELEHVAEIGVALIDPIPALEFTMVTIVAYLAEKKHKEAGHS
jgi:Na+/proline symporter